MRAVEPPHPLWEVSPVLLDSRCGDIFDVCRRVQCRLVNAGTGPGAIGVEAEIAGPRTHRRSLVVKMSPGDERMVVFEFHEAEAGERYTNYTCRTMPADLVGDPEADPLDMPADRPYFELPEGML